jgi:hypothetical protein
LQRRAGDDQKERRFRKPRHGQVAFDAALRVQHLGVDDAAGRHVHLVGADMVEEGGGVAPLHPDLAEGGHVKEAHPLPHGHVLGAGVLEPVLPVPAIAVFARLTGIGEPVRPFPPRDLAEDRAGPFQVFMHRAPPHAARGFDLPVGPVIGIEKAEGLRHAFLQVSAVALERLGAADVDLPQVEGRLAIHDPLRQRHARAAGGHDPDGVVARRDPVAAQSGASPR